jgi:predicted HicB family RNase H-like nuclease
VAAAKKPKTAPTPPAPRGSKRLVVDLSPEVHRKLKLAATAEGLSMRDYVLALLKEKGIA